MKGAKRIGWVLAGVMLALPAQAGKCDYLVKKADSAKGDALFKAYSDLMKCDTEEAATAYPKFMVAAGDIESVSKLAITAIRAKNYNPVWESLEKIPDYSQRDEVASLVGGHCKDETEVVPFLKGAYYGLRSRQFGQWEDALLTCEHDDIASWLEEVVAKPPNTPYDEKYNAVISAYVKRVGSDGMPVLERAAVEAGTNGGPFNTVLEKMDAAVTPQMGKQMKEGDQERLEKSLVAVANAVVPEQAAMVADRLYNAGAEQAAASLLPRIYPDRVQGGGNMLYGAASFEACDKELVIHATTVTEPSKRWSILQDVEEPLRAFKPRLKCDSGEWSVVATPQPVANKGEVSTWVDGLVTEAEGKGLTVKTRDEKGITLD